MSIDRSSSSSLSSGSPSQEFFKLINSYLNNENATYLWLILDRLGLTPMTEPPSSSNYEVEIEIFKAKIAPLVKKNPEELKQKELILLGVAYQFGCGVSIDQVKARLLYKLANTIPTVSPAGEVFTLLAIMNDCLVNINHLVSEKSMIELTASIVRGPYEKKTSHDPDPFNIIYNLKQAIKLGDSKACLLLAILHLQGKRVPQDIFEARNLALEGVSRGDSHAEEIIDAIKDLASLRAEMTKEEIRFNLKKPEEIIRTIRRTIELGCEEKEIFDEIKKLSERKKSVVRSVFFPFGQDFCIRFNVALVEKNKGKFLALAQENPKKFYTLCKNENFKSIEPFLDEKTKKLFQKETKAEESEVNLMSTPEEDRSLHDKTERKVLLHY